MGLPELEKTRGSLASPPTVACSSRTLALLVTSGSLYSALRAAVELVARRGSPTHAQALTLATSAATIKRDKSKGRLW